MKNLFFTGSMVFVFAGCAASNGGGHVVGNSAISEEQAQKMAKAETCACGHKHEAGVDHKACKCGDKKGKASACGKCGTSACTCGH
jgi:hypothetical protein